MRQSAPASQPRKPDPGGPHGSTVPAAGVEATAAELPLARGRRDRLGERGLHDRPVRPRMTVRRPQRGPDEDLERHQCADRVAGEAHHGGVAVPAGALGHAGLHRDLGELDPPRAERVLDHLVGAGADASGRQDQVDAGAELGVEGAEEASARRRRPTAGGSRPRRRPRPPRPACGCSSHGSGRSLGTGSSVSSDPVEQTSTRGRGRTTTSARRVRRAARPATGPINGAGLEHGRRRGRRRRRQPGRTSRRRGPRRSRRLGAARRSPRPRPRRPRRGGAARRS